MGLVVDGARAEKVAEVLIILIVGVRWLGVDAALGVRLGVDTESAWLIRRETGGSAVAGEVTLLKDLDELVFAMALDRTRIADADRVVGIAGVGGRWTAGQTSEDILTKGTERFGAVVDALEQLRSARGGKDQPGSGGLETYVRHSLASIGLKLHLISDKVSSSLRVLGMLRGALAARSRAGIVVGMGGNLGCA